MPWSWRTQIFALSLFFLSFEIQAAGVPRAQKYVSAAGCQEFLDHLRELLASKGYLGLTAVQILLLDSSLNDSLEAFRRLGGEGQAADRILHRRQMEERLSRRLELTKKAFREAQTEWLAARNLVERESERPTENLFQQQSYEHAVELAAQVLNQVIDQEMEWIRTMKDKIASMGLFHDESDIVLRLNRALDWLPTQRVEEASGVGVGAP